jgi:hypothetical protein
MAAATEEDSLFTVTSALSKLNPLPTAYELLIVHKRRRLASMRTQNNGGCTMNMVLVGVVSESEFVRATDYMSELSHYCDYDDWLDSRVGRFMGLSMAGAEASLEAVALDEFLDWCGAHRMRPSEAALDAYAEYSRRPSDREPLSAAG